MKGSEHLCTTRWIRNNTVKNNLLTIVGTMSICWGLGDPLSLLDRFSPRMKARGRIHGYSCTALTLYRSLSIRFYAISHGDGRGKRPFLPVPRYRNFRIHDTFSLPSFTSINFVPQHGRRDDGKKTHVAKGTSSPFSLSFFFFDSKTGCNSRVVENKVPPKGGSMFTCVRVSNLILNLQRTS